MRVGCENLVLLSVGQRTVKVDVPYYLRRCASEEKKEGNEEKNTMAEVKERNINNAPNRLTSPPCLRWPTAL